jgi:hypothetical protein
VNLIIKGGHVIDPSQPLSIQSDVAVAVLLASAVARKLPISIRQARWNGQRLGAAA